MNATSKVALVVLILLFGSNNLYAAPSITRVSGTLTNGSTITISGSSFGTKSTAPPQLSSYDNATAANNFSSGSIGGSWGTRSTTAIGNSSSYRRSAFYQSSNYANCPFLSGDYSQLMWDDPNTSQVYFYVSLWEYITASTFVAAGSGGNMKDMRIYPNDTDSLVTHYISVNEPNQGTVSDYGMGTEPQSECSFLSAVTPYQNWYHHEWWFYMTSDTTGYVYVLINGKNVCTWTSLQTIYNGHSMNAWRLGNVSGDNMSGGSILLDQVYFDNTQAHVFISDKSNITNWLTYSSTAHNEIQVPSAWSTSSIAITFNQGSFAQGATAYLYVVDSNGNISKGCGFTVGGSGGSCSTPSSPPSSPSGLQISNQGS